MSEELARWRRRLGPLVVPLSGIYGLGVWLRARIGPAPRRLPTPVVSVGNLSVGGEGKTPMVSTVVRALSPAYEVAILSRGYGRKDSGSARVVAGAGGRCEPLELSGDEPAMLSRRHPGVTIAVGSRRYDAARLVLERGLRPVFIMDDGFQHRGLARELDIVCMDASTPWEEMALLPRGSLREPWSSLSRAHLLVWTYWEDRWEESSTVRRVEGYLRRRSESGLPSASIFRARSLVEKVTRVDVEDERATLADACDGPVGVLAGIARPERFAQGLEEAGLTVACTEFRCDHHWWTPEEVSAAARRARAQGATSLLVTEKDAVKLGALAASPLPVWCVVQTMRVLDEDGFARRLRDAVDRFAGARASG